MTFLFWIFFLLWYTVFSFNSETNLMILRSRCNLVSYKLRYLWAKKDIQNKDYKDSKQPGATLLCLKFLLPTPFAKHFNNHKYHQAKATFIHVNEKCPFSWSETPLVTCQVSLNMLNYRVCNIHESGRIIMLKTYARYFEWLSNEERYQIFPL